MKRRTKEMQINIKIYPEDEGEEILKRLILKIIDVTNDNMIPLKSVTLEGKVIFESEKGFSI